MNSKYIYLINKLEMSLAYIGVGLGFLLCMDTMKGLISGVTTSYYIIGYAVVMWLIGAVLRVFIIKSEEDIVTPMLNFIYFLFSITFVSIFGVTIAKYFPLTFSNSTNITNAMPIMDYVANKFIFIIIVNLVGAVITILALTFFSKFLYMFVLKKSAYFSGDPKSMDFMKVLIFGAVLAIGFASSQIPLLRLFTEWLTTNITVFLQTYFQWAIDFMFVSPALYYFIAVFKGSEAARAFLKIERK
jgi:hypothetical protein